MKTKQCGICRNELHSQAQFCNYCGVAVTTDNQGKPKNGFQAKTEKQRQARILSMLAFVLIAGVLGFYVLRAATPSPSVEEYNSNVSSYTDELDGTWIGTVYTDNGGRYQYELRINQDGSRITGEAITTGSGGGGSTDMSGSYHDGNLLIQERSSQGTGSGLCYWEVELEVNGRGSDASLSGSYHGMGCGSSGEMTLYRAE
jgi:hypothetical protein